MSGLKGAVKKQAHKHPATDTVKAAVSDEEKVRLVVDMPASLKRQLKMKAAADETTIHQIVNTLIRDYLQEIANK